MEEFEVTMTVTSGKSFRVEATSVQEAAGKASRMLEDCDTFCVSKDEIQDILRCWQSCHWPRITEKTCFSED